MSYTETNIFQQVSHKDKSRLKMSHLQALRDRLPNYTEGKHRVKSGNRWHSVDNAEFYANLATYDQITLNTRSYKQAIIFDVDNPDKYLPPELTPYSSTFNKSNDKNHQVFLFDKAIFTKSPKQMQWYKDNIAIPIAKITYLINADVNYKNLSTKNPFSDQYRVNAHENVLTSVFDLISLYNSDISTITTTEATITKDGRYNTPKYVAMVAELIEHSMMNSKLIFHDTLLYEKSMMLKGEHVGKSLGMSSKDITSITMDAIAKGKHLANEYSQLQKRRAKKSHIKRYGHQVYDNMIRIEREFKYIALSGINPTIENISKRVGLSKETLKRSPYNKWIKRLKIKHGIKERLEVTQMLFDFNEDLPSSEKIIIPDYDEIATDEYM